MRAASMTAPVSAPADELVPTYPLFLRLAGRRVLVVGAGPVGTGKLAPLRTAGAQIIVVAPEASAEVCELAATGAIELRSRPVEAHDLDGAWLVVAAAPPAVNREVHAWAEALRVFVLAVDDMGATDAFSPAVLSRGGIRIALSSEGRAPALIGLVREALEHVLPDDAELSTWMGIATAAREGWKRDGLPLHERRSQLLVRLLEARTATGLLLDAPRVTP